MQEIDTLEGCAICDEILHKIRITTGHVYIRQCWFTPILTETLLELIGYSFKHFDSN